MKILFLFTGGTIGSTVHGGFIGTDRKKPYLLLESYRKKYGIDFEFEAESPYTSLSENNTGSTIHTLCACVGARLNAGFDGIVVTHGTDTLQYSAAALSYAFADAGIPICLVSSNLPIEQEGANGIPNLHGAIRFIREVNAPGVFVPYQNPGEELRIHRGTRLLEGAAFSDRIDSACNAYYGSFAEGKPFFKNPAYRELPNATAAYGTPALTEACTAILRTAPYPGKPYRVLPEVKYILHATYHSGTVNTVSAEARRYFEQAKARGITAFLTGVAPGAAYDSTRAFDELGLVPLYGLTPIAAFVKLWMWQAAHPTQTATAEELLAPLAGDIIA